MATSKKKADAASKSLAKTLSNVSTQAKSLGINTAKADSMVAQTKRQGSTSYKGSTEEKAFLASNIGTESPVIPEKPVPTDTGTDYAMNNASVVPEGYGIQAGNFVKDETASDQMNAANQGNITIGNVASKILSDLNPVDNQMKNAYEDTYGISEKQAQRDLRRAEQEKQQYTTQLNAITANRDASILGLEDTGRGQTSGFIGGEQGRIQRQAAIAALPVQAQLAAAQGNLEIAKSHVDSLFQMKVKDIETEQAYKNTVANTWMSVANQQQSNLLNAAIADSNARAEAKKTNLNLANQWAQTAFDNGQSTLAAKMMKLDTSSKTFAQDLATIQGQVVSTNAQLAQEAQRANIAQSYASTAVSKAELATIQAKQKQIEDAIASGIVQLDSDQQKTAMALGKQFEDESKTFKIQANAYNQILASAQESSAAGDLSLIFGYMKMLDPNSVVRETEFANAENAAGIPERVRAQYNKALNGERLTEATRGDFVDRASKVYNSALDQQVSLEDTYSQQGTNVYGLPQGAVDLIIRDIRAQGAVSDVAFGFTLNNLSDNQLLDLRQSGLLTTPTGQ